MTQHFNEMSEAEQERLVILIEECAEVQQIACKALRHGYESSWRGGETNREGIERELGDLLHAAERLMNSGDLSRTAIEERRVSKPERIAPFLHHQGGL